MESHELKSINDKEKKILDRYRSEYPVKLAALAHDLGVAIKVAGLDLGISGKISRDADNADKQYIIRVNRFEKRERQRFTIAHEIAHFLLHRDIIDESVNGLTDNVLYRSAETSDIEVQANKLAADIIMPFEGVLKKKKEIFGDHPVNEEMIEHLAETFEVSKAAMEIRLSQIEG